MVQHLLVLTDFLLSINFFAVPELHLHTRPANIGVAVVVQREHEVVAFQSAVGDITMHTCGELLAASGSPTLSSQCSSIATMSIA